MSATRAATRRPSGSERLAAWLLRARGYRVLGHRVRTPAGEVDLVCRRGRTLVVVEVKRRRHAGRGAAVAAAEWLHAASDWARDVRVDLVAIDGLRVRHLQGALGR